MAPTMILALLLGLALAPARFSAAAGAKPKGKDPLQLKLEALIEAAGGNRTAGSAGNARALAWLRGETEKLRASGWEVIEQSFQPDIDYAIRSHKADMAIVEAGPKNSENYRQARQMFDELTKMLESVRGKKGTNLILRKKGSYPALAKELLVVGAHFDTITGPLKPLKLTPEAPAPGADDNGAAVVALLQLASDLARLKPKRTLELVFFDFEEEYFLGSYAYAGALAAKGIHARSVSLEMIGHNEGGKNIVKLYTRSEGHPAWKEDFKLARAVARGLSKSRGLVPIVVKNNFGNSDNWSFWRHFHTAITVAQDWEDGFNHAHYHKASDTPDTIDWRYVQSIRAGVAAAISALAN